MTIDLQTLKCGECGSSVLKRTGLNEFTCQHCGSVTLVEDDISDRLDRVLDQVKDAAARRLADEQAARQKVAMRTAGFAVAAVVGITLLVTVVQMFTRKDTSDGGRRAAVASVVDRNIPTDGLKLGEPRQVLVGSGSSARPKLLVVARNETGKPLERASVKATYYDGETRLEERGESLPI